MDYLFGELMEKFLITKLKKSISLLTVLRFTYQKFSSKTFMKRSIPKVLRNTKLITLILFIIGIVVGLDIMKLYG